MVEEEEKRGEEDKNGIKNVAHNSWRKRFEVGSRAAHDARTMREALVAPQATKRRPVKARAMLQLCCGNAARK